MFKFRFIPACLIILCLAASGCGGMSAKENADEIYKLNFVTRFEFGTQGNANVKANKQMILDGRNWNFADILASTIQDAMRDRNISVGELLPTRGGAYANEEAKLVGRMLFLNFTFGQMRENMRGNIVYGRSYPLDYATDDFVKVVKRPYNYPQFWDTSRHYESDEEFYDGLKAELRPHVDTILDDLFRRLKDEFDLDVDEF